MVGPLNVKKAARPLPPDLDEFVSNTGGHGFIIVSFGSNVASILPKTVVDMLATAFGKLKQRVVWRLKGSTSIIIINQQNSQISISEWFTVNELVNAGAGGVTLQWTIILSKGGVEILLVSWYYRN